MKSRYIVGGVIVFVFIIIGGYSFLNSSVEYKNIKEAQSASKKVQVKGVWVKDMESSYEPGANQFTFFLRDDKNETCKVIFTGAKPNNFDIATSVVVKGKYKDGAFHASEILTKCPSKYENSGEQPQSSSM